MKLCVFQGTFNPIHNAHLYLATEISKLYNFDKIIFIPAYKPPHKDYDINLSHHRYEMIKLAIKPFKDFSISDIEYKREGLSYTYYTIQELYKTYNVEEKIHFIIGEDAFAKIQTWHRADELKDLLKFLVFPRSNSSNLEFDELKSKGYNFDIVRIPFMDISSSQIREKVQKNGNIEKLVPKKIEEYINKNGLYRD